jgi:hypothetical protein
MTCDRAIEHRDLNVLTGHRVEVLHHEWQSGMAQFGTARRQRSVASYRVRAS